MTIRLARFRSVLPGAIALAIAMPALAQVGASGTITAPEYGSGTGTGTMSNTDFNTPESDGRPGAKFYEQGMAAYHDKDYRHAVYMLKVAASWAYKPAEYNLGVMYFQGEGVPVDRPLGTAWMFVAAERNTPDYVYARHLMVTSLDDAERTKALELLQQLEPTYGDKVALRRAKAQWAFVKNNQTGTHAGGAVGELHVGVPEARGSALTTTATGQAYTKNSWMGVLTGQSIDGSVAYHQFQESDNPYDRVFLKNPMGTATVGALQPAKSAAESPQSRSTNRPDSNPQNH